MENPQREADDVAEPAVRFQKPDEELTAAAREALNRRSLEEHRAAIDRALRRR